MFSVELRDKHEINNIPITIHKVNTWTKEAVVAESYINLNHGDPNPPNVFLAGNAAHAFPPSGGF